MANKKKKIIDNVTLERVAKKMDMGKETLSRKMKAENRFFDNEELKAFVSAAKEVAGEFLNDVETFAATYETRDKRYFHGTRPGEEKKD